MENQTEQTDKMLLTLTQNELEKTNHFVDLLRDQVAELKAVNAASRQAVSKQRKDYLDELLKLESLWDKEQKVIDAVSVVLLKYIKYLEWRYSRQVECFKQFIEIIKEGSINEQNSLCNIIDDHKEKLEKANRRWTDLQTANSNMVTENRILKKKLDLMDFILGGAGLSKSGDQIIDTGLNSTPKIQAFIELLNFDKQPENQIDTLLTSLPSYSDLEKQVADLKQQLFFSREENQRLSDKCNSLIQENSVYKLRPSVNAFSNEHLVSAEIEKLKEENKTLTNQNDGLRKQNRQLKHRVKTELNYEREWQILSKENKSLKRDITVSEEKSIKLNKDLDEQRTSFKSKIVELQNENKELSSQLNSTGSSINGLYALIDQLKDDNLQLQQQLENTTQNSTRINQLKDINHTLTNTLSNVETQRDTAIRASEYHASKLKLADKILRSLEVIENYEKGEWNESNRAMIKEYISFEHRKEESK